MSTSHKSHEPHNMDQLSDAAANAAKTIKDHVETISDTVKQTASDTASALHDNAAAILEHGQEKAAEAAEKVSGHVKEHPGSSLLAVGIVGFLLGLLFNWHREDD